jgi:hypothetical protein
VVTVDHPVLQKPEQTVRVRVRRAGEGVPGARVQISEIYRGAVRSFTLPPTDDEGAASYTWDVEGKRGQVRLQALVTAPDGVTTSAVTNFEAR